MQPAAPRTRSLKRLSRLALAASTVPVALLLASCSTQSSENTGSSTPPPAPPAAGNTAANSAGSSSASNPGEAAAAAFEKPRKADGKLSVYIVTNGLSPFWDPMVVGMKKAGEELGCDTDWAGPQKADVPSQKKLVEDALAKGVDGIAISCINGDATKPIIDAILEKGVPVLTFDSDSTGSRRLCYIGTNNKNAGIAAGKEAVRLLPQGGKFIGFVGEKSAENAHERQEGFEEAIKGHNIDLIDVLDDHKDPAVARRNVEDMLNKYGTDVQGFLGIFSYNAPQIVQALNAAGKRSQYKVVSFDAEPLTLQALEKGDIDATIVQKPYDFGYLSTKLLYLINRKGWSAAKKEMNIPDSGIYDTGVEVVTPANIKEFRQKLDKLGVKSS